MTPTGQALERVGLDKRGRDCLKWYYDLPLKRLIHEYDQRDRDFVMHVTINGGLFGATGFLLHELKSSVPWINVLLGLFVVGIGLMGLITARGLLGSVNNFIYWQTLMNSNLAKLELAFLPESRYGYWSQTAKRDSKTLAHLHTEDDRQEREQISELKIPKEFNRDLVDYRRDMAAYLKWFWALIIVLGMGITLAGGLRFFGMPAIFGTPSA
jgi:hypothetical protein